MERVYDISFREEFGDRYVDYDSNIRPSDKIARLVVPPEIACYKVKAESLPQAIEKARTAAIADGFPESIEVCGAELRSDVFRKTVKN